MGTVNSHLRAKCQGKGQIPDDVSGSWGPSNSSTSHQYPDSRRAHEGDSMAWGVKYSGKEEVETRFQTLWCKGTKKKKSDKFKLPKALLMGNS